MTISPDGKIADFNTATEQVTGVARDKLVGSEFADYFTDRAKARECYLRVFERGFVKNYPLTLRHTSGKTIDVLYNARTFLDDTGVVRGVFAAARDITEWKQMEAALLEGQQHYRAIADFTSDWTYLVLPDGSLSYVSPASEQVTGYKPEEFYADHELLTRIIVPEDRPIYIGHTHHLSDHGIPEPIYFRIQTRDGDSRWIAHVCEPVHDADGNLTGLRGSNRDDTERRNTENQLRQLAFYDPLTRLPNRRLLVDHLNLAMAAGRRNARYGALIYLDLDNFKPLNDRHGHKVGDLLLIEVARRLKTCVRGIDTVSRFGGDEFVVLLSDLAADKSQATAETGIIAEKMRIKLAESYLLPVKTEAGADITVEHRCTASIGAIVFGNCETSEEDILKWADSAMYQAKDAGRNAIRFHAGTNHP